MTDQHPLTPPPELRCQWQSESPFKVIGVEREDYMIDRSAQWSRDRELDACCSEIIDGVGRLFIDDTELRERLAHDLRAALRPKPPSLKEQAMAVLDDVDAQLGAAHYNVLRRALETLPD